MVNVISQTENGSVVIHYLYHCDQTAILARTTSLAQKSINMSMNISMNVSGE